ncbi:hypothetical protein PIB30_053405 [Stylosanthes scabra]|uniref:Uncharacterized protein n=1 Tax=Stylosanthes scabra TaxID=79078 RepID=A0ABU6VIN8_9FABA|nr:hypothetical protein [Stylosanthes scabra]
MEEEIPLHNEGAADSSNPQPTPEKKIDQRNQTIQQLEAALRELLERQTREAALASEAVKRAEELAKKQQAILDEAEKREKDRMEKLEKLNSKTQTVADHSSKTTESKDHTWRPSTVVTKALGREKSKHPFSSHILAEELPKKFRYPMEIEPYDGTTDPKHHLDAFENRILLLHEELHDPLEAPKNLPQSVLDSAKPEETLRSYLDRFNTECTQIEGLQSQATLMALEEGQTAVKTDKSKKDNPRKEHFRDDRGRKERRSNRSYYNPLNVSQVERVPASRPIKNTSRGDRHSYRKYHKQHGHDTEECRDLLDFVEQGLKNEKFREYTDRYKNRDDERRVRQRPNSPKPKPERRKDEPRKRGTHREIAMILGGIPEEGNPPSRKAAK